MQGDRHMARFFAGLNMVSAAVLMVALSGSLLLLFLFWMAKGYILALLLAHYSDRPASRRAASKKMSIDLIGNTAFALAVVLIWRTFGTLDLAALATQARAHAGDRLDLLGLHMAALTPIALLLLLAAMAKSAQVPLHAWLPGYAGDADAGFGPDARRPGQRRRLSARPAQPTIRPLRSRHAPRVRRGHANRPLRHRGDAHPQRREGRACLFDNGPDGLHAHGVRAGRVSRSRSSHLIAHGIFKATLFLGSGGAVAEGKAGRMLGAAGAQRANTAGNGAVAAATSLLVVALAALLIDRAATQGGATLLLLFAWITGAGALTRTVKSKGAAGDLSHIAAGVPVLAAIGVAYFALVRGFVGFLAPVLPAPAIATAAAPGLPFVLPVAALLLIVPAWRLLGPSRSPWLVRIERQFYVLALHRGYGEEFAGLLLSRPARRRARL